MSSPSSKHLPTKVRNANIARLQDRRFGNCLVSVCMNTIVRTHNGEPWSSVGVLVQQKFSSSHFPLFALLGKVKNHN